MKDNRGEISIMMIITVISLIVFGAICIFMLTGDSGLFIPKSQEKVTENNVNQVQNITESNEVNNQQNVTENNTEDSNQEQNTTNEPNGALTVPMQ